MKKSRINFVDQTGGKRGRAVFVCLCSYDFEGSQLDAVYDKKRFAMKHSFSGGDRAEVHKVLLNHKPVRG